MKLLGFVALVLSVLAGPVIAQNTGSPHYGRVTNLGGSTFYMELPGLRPNRSGETFDVPDPIFAIRGRRGDYTIRASGGDSSLPVLQAWMPELCGLMLRSVAEVSYRARGTTRIAEVACR